MSEMNFEQMLDEFSKTIRNGEVVEGTVIDVKPDEIVLNIGYKADGIITRSELVYSLRVIIPSALYPILRT
ncbi:MAG: S1 RNA-binding domain-containing protein, partial [Clostridiales bacterium]|nr:S1 RNA-binding domain-containing protein [Clostridiales bacterium]